MPCSRLILCGVLFAWIILSLDTSSVLLCNVKFKWQITPRKVLTQTLFQTMVDIRRFWMSLSCFRSHKPIRWGGTRHTEPPARLRAMWRRQSEVDWHHWAAPEIWKWRRKVRKLYRESVDEIDFEGESEAVVHTIFQWFMLSRKSWFAVGKHETVKLIFVQLATDLQQLSSFLPTKTWFKPIITDANHKA